MTVFCMTVRKKPNSAIKTNTMPSACTRPRFELDDEQTQSWLGKQDIVRLPKIHPNLYLASHAAAKRIDGMNISKFCIAGKSVSDYMREHYQDRHGHDEEQKKLAATQSYIVAADTLMMNQRKFNKIFKLAANYIEQSIHKRKLVVHCYAGINRSTTSIIAWWILYGQYKSNASDTDSDYSSGEETDESVESVESNSRTFTDWTQLRDYIRKMNMRYRGVPALINPRFEQLLHGFNNSYGR